MKKATLKSANIQATQTAITNLHAKELVTRVFELIEKSRKIEELEGIPDKVGILPKNRMSIKKYPKINFAISKQEIQSLNQDGILNYDLFTEKATNRLDTISKLLYAIVWKNGDLEKVKHIIQGINDSNKANDTKEDALVFYQFGKYLTKIKGEPIIDQHVIRAFAVYKSKDNLDKVETARKLGTLNKKHKELIEQYKQWLNSRITGEMKTNQEYVYHIDKLLFALGKTIKSKKS